MYCRGLLAIVCSVMGSQALFVSAAEPWRMTDADALFRSLDKNGDGQVEASEVKADKKLHFERLLRTGDTNNDGKLSKQELRNVLEVKDDKLGPVIKKVAPPRINPTFVIRRFDTNKDKKLDASEVPPAVRGRFEQLLESADKNGDKALDGRELVAASDLIAQLMRAGKTKPVAKSKKATGLDNELFRLIDTNGDGKLSKDELRVAEKELDAIPTAKLSAKVRLKPKEVDGKQLVARIWNLDANRDGKISRDEAKGPVERRFEAIDANQDKQLDTKEVEAAVRRFLAAAAKKKKADDK